MTALLTKLLGGLACVALALTLVSSQLEQLRAGAYGAPVTVSRHVDACATDEGSDGQGSRPCVWDARHQGNGQGHSFIVRRDGRVQRISHARAHAFIWGETR